MYSNKFVLSVLLNGHIQTELANGVVEIPFNSQYSIRLRNKNNRKAVGQIFIDGQNVSGGGYIIDPHSYTDIHRHSDEDKAFKFVSLDSEEAYKAGKGGSNPKKIKGVIEVKFFLEKEYQPKYWNYPSNTRRYLYDPGWGPYEGNINWDCSDGSIGRGMGLSSAYGTGGGVGGYSSSLNCGGGGSVQSLNSCITQDGCTVQGGQTGQSFHTSYINTEDNYTTLKLFLQGYYGEPKTSQRYCEKCGIKRKRKANFCVNCGNKL